MEPGAIDITGGHLTFDLTSSPNFPLVLSYAKKNAPRMVKEFNLFPLGPDDLVQEYLLKLHQRGRSLDEVRNIPTWTYTGLRWVAFNLSRHSWREKKSTEPLEWEDGNSKEGYAKNDGAEIYRALANTLEAMWMGEQMLELQEIIVRIARGFLEPLAERERSLVLDKLVGVSAEESALRIHRSTKRVYCLQKPADEILTQIMKELGAEVELLKHSDINGVLSDLVVMSIPEDLVVEYAHAA